MLAGYGDVELAVTKAGVDLEQLDLEKFNFDHSLLDTSAVISISKTDSASIGASKKLKQLFNERLNAFDKWADPAASEEQRESAVAAAVAAVEAAPTEYDRTCVVCWEAEREVRFACGHAICSDCCHRCADRLGERASWGICAACPVCKEAIGCWVEEGAPLGEEGCPTFRQP